MECGSLLPHLARIWSRSLLPHLARMMSKLAKPLEKA
jgi:hypothetical protein